MYKQLDYFIKKQPTKEIKEVCFIKKKLTFPFLLNIHYLKRIPPIQYAFGLFINYELEGVITYGVPPSPCLVKGICGKEYKDIVLELNRLCLIKNRKNDASFFISQTIKALKKISNWILVSYADTKEKHIGKVYQASNWIYTGLSAKNKDVVIKGLHSKTIFDKYKTMKNIKTIFGEENIVIEERSRKHRYLYFAGDKRFKRKMMDLLKYDIKEYPKRT